MNIIETVQKNLGFVALEKIDPNTQETMGSDMVIGNQAISQAGIPAILLGIYNRLELNPELGFLDEKANLLEKIFGASKGKVVQRIIDYSRIKDKHSEQQLEHIAAESMRVISENIGAGAEIRSIRSFVARNKPDVLLYLPPALELGKILQNNNLDDRTGKMEGPVSSLMHSVEKVFNSSDNF